MLLLLCFNPLFLFGQLCFNPLRQLVCVVLEVVEDNGLKVMAVSPLESLFYQSTILFWSSSFFRRQERPKTRITHKWVHTTSLASGFWYWSPNTKADSYAIQWKKTYPDLFNKNILSIATKINKEWKNAEKCCDNEWCHRLKEKRILKNHSIIQFPLQKKLRFYIWMNRWKREQDVYLIISYFTGRMYKEHYRQIDNFQLLN